MKLPKFTLGDFLKIVSIVGVLIGCYVTIKSDVAVLKTNDIVRKDDIKGIKKQLEAVERNQVISHTNLTSQINGIRSDMNRIYDFLLTGKATTKVKDTDL